MNSAKMAAGLAVAACLFPTLAVAQSTQAKPDRSVALPPARDGVITPSARPVDPHMPVVHPGVSARTPVIHPPTAQGGDGVVRPR